MDRAQYKQLKCENCQNNFVHSVEEQELYRERGLTEPKYCAICRGMIDARKRDKSREKYMDHKDK